MRIIDLHQDVALNSLYSTGKDITKTYSLHQGSNNAGFAVNNNTDIPRLKKGNVKLIFSTIFSLDNKSIEMLAKESPENYNFNKVFKIKSGLAGALEQYSYYFDIFSKSKDLVHVKSKKNYLSLKSSKKIGFLIHLEGIDYFGNSLDFLDASFELGARSIALTWRNQNAFASGNSTTGGLTYLGKKIIKKIKAKKMIFDLAHANKKTFWDAMKFVDFPVIVSHSLCQAIVDNSRNIDDDQIKAVAKTGGLVGLAVIPDYIGGDKISDYIKHFVHISDLVGVNHVAFGTDFDGLIDKEDRFIKNFEDVSKYNNVLKGFKKAGFTNKDIEKFTHENVERVILQILPQ